MKGQDMVAVGDKIELNVINSNNNHKKYISQVLDIVDDETLMLSGPIYKTTFIPLHIGELIEVTFYKKGKGRFYFKAEIIERNISKLYTIKVKALSDIIRLQERNYYRLNNSIEVIKKHNIADDTSSKEIEERCITEDISGGGMKILCNYNHQLNEIINVTIFINDNQINTICKIVRIYESNNSEYSYSIGVCFVDIGNDSRDKIIKYIFDEQRKLRKKGLI